MKKAFGIMMILLIAGMLGLVHEASSSEFPVVEWNKTYGGTGLDACKALVQTGDGGYTLAGDTYSFGAGRSDAWLVKTDANGNMSWNMTYGGTGDDEFCRVLQTGDGGYALVGYTDSFGNGDRDCWLVKTDVNGNMQWRRTYGGTGDDRGYDLIQAGDGGYALVGYTDSFGAGGYDFWLVKTNATGYEEWNMTYGGRGYDEAYAMVQAGDGGYTLAGYTDSFGAGGYDFWLVKTNATGYEEWNMTYGGTGFDVAQNVLIQTSDGGYALEGLTGSFGAGSLDAWLVKTDSYGTMQWNKSYGGTEVDGAYALVQTGDGGYTLAGETYSFGDGDSDFWLVKTDAYGNMQWNKTYGGTGYDCAYAVAQADDGGYALAGPTASFGAGSTDFWLIKLAPPISWEYVFEDPCRGTILKISTDDRYFQFIAPGKDFGVKHDPKMTVLKNIIGICYGDSTMRLAAAAVVGKINFCSAIGRDKQANKTYLLTGGPA